jgi:hypothetical protein
LPLSLCAQALATSRVLSCVSKAVPYSAIMTFSCWPDGQLITALVRFYTQACSASIVAATHEVIWC